MSLHVCTTSKISSRGRLRTIPFNLTGSRGERWERISQFCSQVSLEEKFNSAIEELKKAICAELSSWINLWSIGVINQLLSYDCFSGIWWLILDTGWISRLWSDQNDLVASAVAPIDMKGTVLIVNKYKILIFPSQLVEISGMGAVTQTVNVVPTPSFEIWWPMPPNWVPNASHGTPGC